MHRVYLETFDKPIWAIDDGNIETAQRFEQVVWYAVGCTKYDLSADNVTQPRCWLEFPDAELKAFGTTALLR